MTAMGMSSTANIITILSKGRWQALIVQDSKVLWHWPKSSDTKEAALEELLAMLSTELYYELEVRFDDRAS
jgi:hypothetical protein